MLQKEKLKELTDILAALEKEEFYGELVIVLQKGKLERMKKNQSLVFSHSSTEGK